MTTISKNIDINKKYVFSDEIVIVRYEELILVISVDTANWIVLQSAQQLRFFELLKHNTISDAIAEFGGLESDVCRVITQIEAKSFDNMDVKCHFAQRLHIYLTNSCNLRCPHCYMYAGEKGKDELSTKEVCYVLNCFKNAGGAAVTFSGGEICMRPDLFEIVKHAYDLEFDVQLMTNGILWENTLIEKISPYISNVQISIDGYSEDENQKIRGKGSFEKALSTCDKFVKQCKSVQIAVTPLYTDDIENQSTKYAEFGKKLIEKYKDFKFRVIFSSELLDGREVSLSKEQKLIYKQYIDLIYKKCFGNVVDISFVEARKKREIMDGCSFGNLTVSSVGDVFFCGRIPFLRKAANVRTDSFEHILHLSKIARKKSNINSLKPCNACELKYICGGGCRIDYFPELTSCADIESLKIESIRPRQCSIKEKRHYYDLMIRTNEMIFQ